MFFGKEVKIIFLSLGLVLGLFGLIINNINQINIQSSNTLDLISTNKKLQKKLDGLVTAEDVFINKEIESKLTKKELETVFNGIDTKKTDLDAIVNIDKQNQNGSKSKGENITIITR